MSEADPDAVTVSTDGITLRKTVDTEQFEMLAVVIELTSEREDAAHIQVVDALPTGVPMEDIGFHPEYGAEHWSVEDGHVAFEREIATRETYTTIYVIRDYPKAETGALLTEPDVDLVHAPESVGEVVDEGRSEVVRDFVAGEADLPGLEDELATDAEATAASEEISAEPSESPEESAAEDRELRESLSGGVVPVLVEELREGNVDPEDRRLLGDELLGTEGTVEARLTHLQQRVSDLEAYTDALEEFIDQEGTGEQVISDLRDDVAGLEREVHETDDRVDDALDRLSTVEDDVAEVDARADDFDGRLEDLRDEQNTLRRNLRNDLQDLEEDLEDFEKFHERLSSVFGGEGGNGGGPGDIGD